MAELMYVLDKARGHLPAKIVASVVTWKGEPVREINVARSELFTRDELELTDHGLAALAAWDGGDHSVVDTEHGVLDAYYLDEAATAGLVGSI